ncbi:unnamed protein product [Lymnaea stagnalis]|uniref:Cadherin domain-containing protein n=1 Tax=Lymnaea stagnalis TaxID=6523 RepID=A0AAV2HB10_LYMST
MAVIISMVIVILSLDLTLGQNAVPIFTNYEALNNRYLPEDLPLDYSIGKISAYDPDGSAITFTLSGNGGEYFKINDKTGEVTLKKLLDFETEYEIKLNIIVTDATGQSSTVQGKVFVNDENDNFPVFTKTGIYQDVNEDAPIGYEISPISVTDVDTKNSILSVTCSGSTPLFIDACNKFELKLVERSNKFWRGILILKNKVDYETRLAYSIQLTAYDGVHNVTTEVHVEIIDVNDTPPRWTLAEPVTINEELAIGASVQRVSAVDGDVTNKRPIYYELEGNNTQVFGIDNSTGVIFIKQRIDFDAPSYPKGVPYDLTIVAREIARTNPLVLGSDDTTTARVNIKVTVRDIDDNTPTFSQKNYEAYIDENIVSGANVPGLQMTVTDIDSGSFNSFKLVTLNSTDVFGIIPEEDAASSSATLFVKKSDLIDYEKGPRQYIIQVEARENLVSPALTGTCTVTIYVRDINDITPNFSQPSYNVSIYETTQINAVVIDMDATDPEAGNFGTAGIRYKLFGNIPPNFQIDEITGVIRVADCSPRVPGQTPCIDYEKKREYVLTVAATDNLGDPNTGRTKSVPLTVYILDENDNVPQPEASYVRYINEEETVTINPLIINASDPDTVGGPLTYSIQGDTSGLWQITLGYDQNRHAYANITARRGVLYTDAPDTQYGAFRFSVIVQDAKFSYTSNVIIYVIDINNNAPIFGSSVYRAQFMENTTGNYFVIQVTATDADSPATGNGQIDFYIQSGAVGKFLVTNVTRRNNAYTANIYTTPDATFNFETQRLYEMDLIARDRGTPSSKYGTVKLYVDIIDVNNRNPRINPLSQSVSVSENEPIGTSVYKILAEDPDFNSVLRFSFTPQKANDGTGSEATSTIYDFRNMFRIEPRTGEVFVNGTLHRKSVARITYSVLVQDIAASPVQDGTGSFLIYILEYNDQAPTFEQPYYNISIEEEQNINSFVQNLNCRDEDDKIAGYGLTQDNPRTPLCFAFLPGSGAMIVIDRIDFEQIERFELTATCTDTGQPQLSNSTRILVNVININDNTPIFNQISYRTSFPEGNYSGPLNINVNATDRDKGDFGVVRYSLSGEALNYFTIDSITGVITFVPGASFDRETSSFFNFEVTAYDSPLNATVRRQATVPVYISILDVNDNCPIFSKTHYEGKVPESAGAGTNVIDLVATDADEGINAEIVYTISGGNSSGLFNVQPNGRIVVVNNLKKLAGFYTFNVRATDKGGNLNCSTIVPVTIEVQVSLNNAPIWLRPPNRDFVIYVLESQYDGMLVYASKANDTDVGPNGIVDYYFLANGGMLVSNTSEFNMNRVTGVIRAEVVFDREQVPSYFLTLVAKDHGNPAASSETTLTVIILDVDDNDPKFPTKDGVVIPLVLPESGFLKEGDQVPVAGLKLGQCNATDADSAAANNKIYYRILAGQNDVTSYVRVDINTCEIYLTKALDFEKMPTLSFDIYAYNEKNDDRVIRNKRDVNPSVLPVTVRVTDVNDNSPVFVESHYYQCAPVDATYRQNILEVSATDLDAGDNAYIKYYLSGTTVFDIDTNLGIIYNLISFQYLSDSQRRYDFKVIASDGTSNATADVTIVVLSTSNLVKLTISRPLTDVQPFQQQLVRTIEDSSDQIKFACITRMVSHVEDDGSQNLQATDVYIGAMSNSDSLYSASGLLLLVQDQLGEKNSAYKAIYIADAKEDSSSGEFILKEDAVLAILIITILLIFLAIVLFIVACLCIRSSKKKKTRKIQARHSTTIHVTPQPVLQPVDPSRNPVYYSEEQDDENPDVYAIVAKKPSGHHIHPVVLPAQEVEELPPPVEPERLYAPDPEPEPVIETFVVPDESPHHFQEPPHHFQEPPHHFQEPPEPPHHEHTHFEPEFEDNIETMVVDPQELPYPPDEGEIETEIRDSPTSSPPRSHRSIGHDSPRSSPAGSRRSDSN